MPFLSLVTLTFDYDFQTRSSEGPKHVFRVNLVQICSAVPEIFHTQTRNRKHRRAAASSKSITVDDFRGISISPVISKVFEHCILDRYSKFFITSLTGPISLC